MNVIARSASDEATAERPLCVRHGVATAPTAPRDDHFYRTLAALASLELTLWALPLLAIGILAAYASDTRSAWLLAVPLAVMSVNLACAIVVNKGLRARAPLLVFHL